tara:strand:- start:28951 stop:32037 length:3087 start_codon:yes stop_codon:yes gene_type:complete
MPYIPEDYYEGEGEVEVGSVPLTLEEMEREERLLGGQAGLDVFGPVVEHVGRAGAGVLQSMSPQGRYALAMQALDAVGGPGSVERVTPEQEAMLEELTAEALGAGVVSGVGRAGRYLSGLADFDDVAAAGLEGVGRAAAEYAPSPSKQAAVRGAYDEAVLPVEPSASAQGSVRSAYDEAMTPEAPKTQPAFRIPADATPRLRQVAGSGRYDVVDKGQDGARHRFEYSVRGTEGFDEVPAGITRDPDTGREWSRPTTSKFDPEMATLEAVTDKWGTSYKVNLKPGWSEDIPTNEALIYRGMSQEEWLRAKETGAIKSSGEYNLGPEQEGLTYFSTDAGSAAYYASSFAPPQFKATPDRPAVVVAIKRRPGVSVKGTAEHEIGLSESVPLDEVVELWEGAPYRVDDGFTEIIRDLHGTRDGSGSAPDIRLGWRRIETQPATQTPAQTGAMESVPVEALESNESFREWIRSQSRGGNKEIIEKLQGELDDIRALQESAPGEILYHGTGRHVADKIESEGFSLSTGRRGGPLGRTKEIQNQAVFLSPKKGVARSYGQNKYGPDDALLTAKVNTQKQLDFTDPSTIPSDLRKKALEVVREYEGPSVARLRQEDIHWLIDQQDFAQALRDRGYDSVRFLESSSTSKSLGLDRRGETVAVLDPAIISLEPKNRGSLAWSREQIIKGRSPAPPTQTPAFRRWFGESKIVDEGGEPVDVYHGTSHDFDAFSPSTIRNRWGSASYFSDNPVDVAKNYARAEGPDLQGRIGIEADYIDLYELDEDEILDAAERILRENPDPEIMDLFIKGDVDGLTQQIEPDLVQEIAKHRVMGDGFRTLKGNIKMENPVYLDPSGKKGTTEFEIEAVWDESGEDIIDEVGSGVELLEAIDTVGRRWDADYAVRDIQQEILGEMEMSGGSITAVELDEVINANMSSIMDPETGEIASGEFIKEVFEELGFDGIVADAYHYFGPRNIGAFVPGMDHVTPGTYHYMTFEPTQFKSHLNVGTYDPKDPRFTRGIIGAAGAEAVRPEEQELME